MAKDSGCVPGRVVHLGTSHCFGEKDEMCGSNLNEHVWSGADGPTMLRVLREASGLSQFEVALRLVEAEYRFDQSHLHKIESGKIARPAFKTVDAILTVGLKAPYSLRRDVLEAFGYRLPWTLPTEQEIEEARRLCAMELHDAMWPSYLSDYANRIWGWNRAFPRLIGNREGDPGNDRYIGLTVLEILFNPALETSHQIANAVSYGPVALAWFKVTTRSYTNEPWLHDFLARAEHWPGFLELWDQIPEGPMVMLEEQAVVPVQIHVPGYRSPLWFRPTLVNHLLDMRFQIVHLVPFSAETMAICASWAAEDPAGGWE